MRIKSRLAVLSVVIATALVVSGCTNSGSPGASSPKQTADTTLSKINPHPVGDLEQGGVLRLPLQQLPEQWNYYHTDGALYDTFTVLRTSMPGVFVIDSNNEPKLDTNYVTSAELAGTDPQVVKYTINEKAVWNDGTPMTWKDFAAVWKANSGTDEKYQSGDTTGYRDIVSVEKGATDRDVTVTFSQPFADWKKLFIRLYPAAQMDTPEAFNTGWLDKIPTSAGPFILDISGVNKDAQTVTVRRNDKWWGPRPVLDSVIFRALASTADVDAYLNNELDVVSASSTQRFDRVKSAPNSEVRIATSPRYNHITFGSAGPLKDDATRVALQQAIDRKSLADTLFGGIPYKVELLNNHLFTNVEARYKDNAKGVVDFNPEKAKKALDDAGWVVSGDGRARDGVSLNPRLVIPAATPISQQLAELIQNQLAAVNVKVTIDAVPVETFFRDNINIGNFDMAIFVWVATGYLSDSMSIFQEGDKTQNYGKISSAEITSLLNKANAELDPEKLAKLVNDADSLIWKSGHSLPIAQAPVVIATRPTLANYGAFNVNFDPDWTTVGWVKK